MQSSLGERGEAREQRQTSGAGRCAPRRTSAQRRPAEAQRPAGEPRSPTAPSPSASRGVGGCTGPDAPLPCPPHLQVQLLLPTKLFPGHRSLPIPEGAGGGGGSGGRGRPSPPRRPRRPRGRAGLTPRPRSWSSHSWARRTRRRSLRPPSPQSPSSGCCTVAGR